MHALIFEYTAVNKTGTEITGERDAETERDLAEVLRAENLLLVEAHHKGAKKGFDLNIDKYFSFLKRISLIEKVNFSRNLAVMIGAGLSLTKALDALQQQSENVKMKELIGDVLTLVTQGKSFSESLRKYERVFGVLYINMVESGELSGKLEHTLKLLARQMKRDYDLRAKVRGAMIYPVIIFTVLLGIGVLMMVYVVPTITETFTQLKVKLPLSTRIIIGASNALLNYYWAIILVTAGGGYGVYRLVKTPAGKAFFDRAVLHLPAFGSLVKEFNSARLARTLGSLISSGVTITKALEITASVLGNSLFSGAVADAAREIQKGIQINVIFKRYPHLFPPLVVQMIGVGEETGTISKMFLRLAIFYEAEVSEKTKNLSSIIEPLMMVIIGVVVGFFAVSILQPIYGSLGNL